MNINIKFWIFKLVYSGVAKPGWGGVNFIWYVKIEYNEVEVFWNANDWQNTSRSSVMLSNTFNKNIQKNSITSAKWGQ